MPELKYKNPIDGPMCRAEFSCWTGHYYRLYSGHSTVEALAEAIGVDASHLIAVMSGLEDPSQPILDMMNMKVIQEKYEEVYYVCEERTRVYDTKRYISND